MARRVAQNQSKSLLYFSQGLEEDKPLAFRHHTSTLPPLVREEALLEEVLAVELEALKVLLEQVMMVLYLELLLAQHKSK
jgi:hypothetical protein